MTTTGEYRAIGTRIVDAEEYHAMGPHARLMLLVLRLRLGMAGIAVLIPAQLSDWCGLDADETNGALRELEQQHWIVRGKRVIWLRNGLRYDPHISLKNTNHRSAIIMHLQSLPRETVVLEYCGYYGLRAEGICTHMDDGQWEEWTMLMRERHGVGYIEDIEPAALEKKTQKPEKEKPQPNDLDLALTELFIGKILEHTPNRWEGFLKQEKCTEKTIREKWANEFRLLRTRDKRDVEETTYIVENFMRHSFWSKTLQSPRGLRGELRDGRSRYLRIMEDIRNADGPQRSRRHAQLGGAEKYKRLAASVVAEYHGERAVPESD